MADSFRGVKAVSIIYCCVCLILKHGSSSKEDDNDGGDGDDVIFVKTEQNSDSVSEDAKPASDGDQVQQYVNYVIYHRL